MAIHTLCFVTGSLLTVCQVSAQKTDTYEDDMMLTSHDMTGFTQASNPGYAAYKRNAYQQIADNKKKIAGLRAKINVPGMIQIDDVKRQQIDRLEKRNVDMDIRLNHYQKGNTDWQGFTRDFDHDMADLQRALMDFSATL